MAIDARYPIIYVRGYAMTGGEKDETAADPFCGFNVGSTVYRAVSQRDKPAQRFVFESPVIRLAKDFGYTNVYQDGLDILDPGYAGKLSPQSIIIYRYYDDTAPLLGGTVKPSIEGFAQGLSTLILKIRDMVCRGEPGCPSPEAFRCYLVAHSMGGLICRAFLQNAANDPGNARALVDKFFTYATPHNGIDVAGLNVPRWLGLFDINTFNRQNLAADFGYDAALTAKGRSDYLRDPGDIPISRCFCMVGTNRSDYEVAQGLSRTFAGHGSDGLVRIENATLCGVDARGVETVVATAYAYRSHSGYFGIVNSEEAYQNLTRFLFGDVRVDVSVDVASVSLPPKVEQARQAGKAIDAMYQFELLASPRGKPWFLSRRTAEEDSVACRSQAELTATDATARKNVYLSTIFLANIARVDPTRTSLSYSVTLGVRVPDYTVDHALWFDEHYEGAYLFRDTLIVEIEPPAAGSTTWQQRTRWQSEAAAPTDAPYAPVALVDGKAMLRVAFASGSTPGITGSIAFAISAWNVG
ncbi:hypothetical protein KPL74_05890 [Bacillus sp. NP157]|nr:hypothetical protein KPL74_05890 [Bacillus sp. NP157]